MHVGASHEEAVANRLREHGWHVEPFGQGLFSELIRNTMLHHEPKVMLRWLPDLIASRNGVLRLIEAKSRTSKTENHSLEIDSLMALTACEVVWGVPVVIVWSDFTVNRPRALKVVRWVTTPDARTNGSKTPFVLLRKTDQQAFEWAFALSQQRAAS